MLKIINRNPLYRSIGISFINSIKNQRLGTSKPLLILRTSSQFPKGFTSNTKPDDNLKNEPKEVKSQDKEYSFKSKGLLEVKPELKSNFDSESFDLDATNINSKEAIDQLAQSKHPDSDTILDNVSNSSSFFQGADLNSFLKSDILNDEVKPSPSLASKAANLPESPGLQKKKQEESAVETKPQSADDRPKDDHRTTFESTQLINQQKLDELKETIIKQLERVKFNVLTKIEPLKRIEWNKLRKEPKQFIKSAAASINDATGYNQIEVLKKDIEIKTVEFEEAKQELKKIKLNYQNSIEMRAKGQRDINNLLQRKHSWSDQDVTNFTQLYRNEHNNEQNEAKASLEVKRVEELVEVKYDELVNAIRTRYHEEQLWSDKIRSASTYWTLALILVNTLLFLSVHTLFEPRRRAMLVKNVDSSLKESWQEEKLYLEELITPLVLSIDKQTDTTQNINSRLDTIEAILTLPAQSDTSINNTDSNQLALMISELLNPANPDPNPEPVSIQEASLATKWDPSLVALASGLVGAILSSAITLALK